MKKIFELIKAIFTGRSFSFSLDKETQKPWKFDVKTGKAAK